MIRITALEIICNRDDLYFVITQPKSKRLKNKWAFVLTRGAKHNYKELCGTTEESQLVDSREDMLWNVEMGVLYLALAGIFIPEGSPLMDSVTLATGREGKRAAMRSAISTAIETDKARLVSEGADPQDYMTLAFADKIMRTLTKTGKCDTSLFANTPTGE